MTLFPAARWRGPVPNQGGPMGPIRGLVLHIQQGTEAGTDAWLHNPASKVSAHFGNPKTGGLDQWVEVGTVAWAEVNGNFNWVSLENEGNSGDALTASQLENAAQLLAWLHGGFGVPLQISDDPANVPGLTGHGLGGANWGGHFDCPGPPILAQRQQIINRASAIVGAPTTPAPSTEDDMPIFSQGEIPQDTDAHMVVPPPPNIGANWGNVWFSLGSDFADVTVRCAAYVHGVGWDVKDNVVVLAAGDRVNPWGGPLPPGVQKISIERRSAAGVLGYLIEAAHK